MIDCSKAVNFIKEKHRMTNHCRIRCAECPLSMSNNGTDNKMTCDDLEKQYPEKAVEIVQKWSDEHPQKTYLSELLRAFPKAILDLDGKTPLNMCPSMLGLKEINNCHSPEDCIKCWNQPIEESEK